VKNNIPEVRFPGYSGDWDEHKLGEFVQDYVEKTIVQNQYPVLTSSQKRGIIFQEEYFANRQVTTENNIGYFVLPRGYFTYRSRSDNGLFKFNRNDLVDKGIISYFYPVFKISNGNSDFFLKMLNSTTKKQVALEAEGTGQKVLSLKKFKSINVVIPDIQEQNNIGNFFKKLDDAIALHQQELTSLKQTRKGFLQKMFPKEGESVPEVRFPGFTGDWEVRKLDSIVDKIKSYSLSRDVETSEYTGYKYIHYGDIHTKVADVIDGSSNLPNIKAGNYELLEKGDLVLADASEDYQGIATPAVITIDLPYKLVSGLHTIALRPKSKLVDSLFLYYLINSPIFREYGYKAGTGMKVFGISATNLLKFENLFPLLEEQVEIGIFLNRLDDMIALHQRELDALKETKNAFLQKMFV
jgi:type I restriction enzyme, S subunit